MKHLLLTALAILALVPTVHTQSGPKVELKGVKKIYVYANEEKDRERILKVLRENAKKLPGVEVVSLAGDADVSLLFSASGGAGIFSDRGIGDGTGLNTTQYTVFTNVSGTLVDRKGNERRLVKFAKLESETFETPSVQFAKKFVKAWVKENK